MSFHSRQSLSVSFFHVSLGLPASGLPSIYISHAVLIAPLERSTCPNQRSLLSLKMRLRSSSSSFASNSLDLTVATSSGLILQMCLIMALSLRCKFVLVSGQVSLAWSMVLCTQGLQGITVRLGTVSAGAIRFMSIRNKYGRTLVNPNFCSADTWS